MANILIAGLGNLGSRYLQGIASYPDKLTIFAQDVSSDSLGSAKNYWNEATGKTFSHRISFEPLLNNIPKIINTHPVIA